MSPICRKILPILAAGMLLGPVALLPGCSNEPEIPPEEQAKGVGQGIPDPIADAPGSFKAKNPEKALQKGKKAGKN